MKRHDFVNLMIQRGGDEEQPERKTTEEKDLIVVPVSTSRYTG